MKIIGLTGPSGAGKGFSYHFFKKLDIPCIDTDDVYHKLLLPPSTCVDELVKNFGTEILQNNGSVDRKILANIVFSDESHKKLELLNQTTHKYVLDKTVSMLSEYKKAGKVAAVIDAPLLFESGIDKECDFTVAVISDENVRVDRIMSRDSITREAAEMRVHAQKSDDFYTSMATYSVTNNSDMKSLELQLEAILIKENLFTDRKDNS